MPRIHVRHVVDAPPDRVWRELADIARHVEWMADADTIEFDGDQRSGVGTRFECVTRVGPLRTRDRMEVTRWRDGQEIAVRHTGLVRGEGQFTVRTTDQGQRTEVGWNEQLHFRWYLGGPVTGWLATPVLRRLWRGNLGRLAALVDERATAEREAAARRGPRPGGGWRG